MRAAETATRLTEFRRRSAGTDAERRAAVWLAGELRAAKQPVLLETFWCRPNWAGAQAWHLIPAIAGSLLAVSHPRVGGALVIVALACVVADWATGRSPGRRLTRERASQNVVVPGAADSDRVRLIITANYDAGRTGLVYRDALRRPAAAIMRRAGALLPGWLAWLVIELLVLVAVAAVRDGGASGTAIGAVQLIPTAVLVIQFAALLDLASAAPRPAASDNASGAAVALALARALRASPPRRLDVSLVLQGAGDASMTGLRRHLRARRHEMTPATAIVLGIGPCGAGRPTWWHSDGPMLPLAFGRRLRTLAATTAAPAKTAATAAGGGSKPATGHRGRGTSPALPARMAGYPALTIGCLDERGLAPRSHQAGDTAGALDPQALDRLVEFALTLVDAIDADLAKVERPEGPARAAA